MKIIDGGICAVGGVIAAGACEDEYGVALLLLKMQCFSSFYYK